MNPKTVPTITTALLIGGHRFNPQDFTLLVGVEPTKIWTQQHEWVKLIRPDIATIGWVYELKKQRKWSLGEAIEEILDVVWSKREEVHRFLSENRLKMSVDCKPFGDASVLEYIIQPAVIRKMAFFSASLSLAVYKDEL
jgi:hypothetical protein